MQLAALMLCRGDDVGDVAAATDVPVAMLDLMRLEVADEADHNQQHRATVEYAGRHRRVVVCVLVMEVAAVANVVVGVTALIGHVAGLGLLTLVVSAALIVAVHVVAKYSTRPAHHTRRARFAGRRDHRDRGCRE